MYIYNIYFSPYCYNKGDLKGCIYSETLSDYEAFKIKHRNTKDKMFR